MEQQFQLKYHGKLSLFEQNQMTSEERAWFIKRLIKEDKDNKEREEKQTRSMPKPRRPSIPRR
jgi:hypothetical protein